MKTFAKIKFWSFGIFGTLFVVLGSYFFVSGNSSEGTAKTLMIVGIGQLVIFYGLLFYLYKGKIKEALNN